MFIQTPNHYPFTMRIIRSRRNSAIIILVALLLVFNSAIMLARTTSYNKIREDAKVLHDVNILSRIKRDKGTGCNMPRLNPFAEEIMKFMDNTPKITCPGQDWVTCDGGQCYVVPEILKVMPDIECFYSDIIYVNDDSYYLGSPVRVIGDQRYNLTKSDHVKVSCQTKTVSKFFFQNWKGLKTGFRPVSVNVPPGREKTPNVLVLTFDSVSHNQFIRSAPESYRVLTQELGAVVLKNYNVVGDGTVGALFPVLTGKSELEFPDARRKPNQLFGTIYFNPEHFLFDQLRKDGYHTAYLEDLPETGTFTWRFNGFEYQPAYHYLRSFFVEENKVKLAENEDYFCVGDTPTYKLMMNLTHKFITGKGKRFGFVVISDVAHEEPSIFSTVDDDLAKLLKSLVTDRVLFNTFLIVMSDHGSRYPPLRRTYQGKLEERLPFMAIVLPETLKMNRPNAKNVLKGNANVLTTPFDIHTTILDVVGLKHLRNNYTVMGSELPRGMSLLDPIPMSRSCPEADVLTHWCACLNWLNVPHTDPMFERVPNALARYINELISENDNCANRNLISIEWVKKENVNEQLLKFVEVNTENYYVPIFAKSAKYSLEFYQVKIIMSPMEAAFEGTVTYVTSMDKFLISEQDISRVNAYGAEPNCVARTHPHLIKYCYCKSCFKNTDECSSGIKTILQKH